MYRLKQILSKLTVKSRVLLSALLLTMIVTGITGTLAWNSGRQSALNLGQTRIGERPVHLLKLEIDTEGNQTELPVPGADFLLFEIPANNPDSPVQIQATFTTDQEGRITVSLPPGRYFFQEIRLPYGFAPDLDSENQPIRRYDFTVTEESNNERPIVTAYNRRLAGDLIIEKMLVNDDGLPLSPEQLAQLFEFRVTFSDGGTYKYQIDGQGAMHELTSGETLSLRHGQRAVFTGIPVGVHYMVEEINFQNGQANNSSGNIHSEPSLAAFTNRDMTRRGNLILEKEVVNSDGSGVTPEQKLIDFNFEVELSNVPDGASFRYTTNRYQIDDDPNNDADTREGTVSSGDTLTLRHGEILTIHNLPVGASYKIREVATAGFVSGTETVQGNIVQDTTPHHRFVNSYQVGGVDPEPATLSFEKQVVSENEAMLEREFEFEVTFEPSDGQTFQYRIIEGSTEGALQDFVSGDTIRLRHGQKVVFADLPAGLAYNIREIPSDDFFEMLDEVNGTTIIGGTSHHLFINREVPSGSAQLVIEKNVVGTGYDANHEFLFDLYINDVKQDEVIRLRSGQSSTPITLALGDRWRVVEHDSFGAGFIQIGISNGTGSVEIGHLGQVIHVRQTNRYIHERITLSGVKSWEMPEGVQPPQEITLQLMQGNHVVRQINVTGPTWTYTFENLPKFDSAGNEIQYRIREVPVPGWNAVTNPDNINIHNVWMAPIRGSLEIEKQLTGDSSPHDEKFEFVMNPGNHVVNITNSGRARFPEVTFERPGTFEFTIHETRGSTLGWTYDNTEYKWFARVELQGGTLVMAEQWLTKNGERVQGLRPVFVNRFDSSALLTETINIPVKKTWDHKELTVNLQPQSIIIQLMVDGREISRRQLSLKTQWQTLFQDLPRYDADGQEVDYQVKELPVNGYAVEITGNAQEGFSIRNTYVGMAEPPSKTPDAPSTTERLPDVGDTLTITAIVLGLVCMRIAYLLYKENRTDKT